MLKWNKENGEWEADTSEGHYDIRLLNKYNSVGEGYTHGMYYWSYWPDPFGCKLYHGLTNTLIEAKKEAENAI